MDRDNLNMETARAGSPYSLFRMRARAIFLRFIWSIMRRPNVCRLTFSAFDEWITSRPQIAEAIVWEDALGPLKYAQWYDLQKLDLYDKYLRRCFKTELALVDPPPNLLADILSDNDFTVTLLDPKYAWPLYLSYVANSIWLEETREREIQEGVGPASISWQLTDYSSEELTLLLSSRCFYRWVDNCRITHDGLTYDTGLSGYIIESQRTAGRSLPAPPDYVLSFLNQNDMIASSRSSTVASLLEWFRKNARHYPGRALAGNMESLWDYRGDPPVSRVIEFTDNLNHIYYAGCHGAAGFLSQVLKAVNIPGKYVRPSDMGDAQLGIFTTQWMYLDHADNLCTAYAKCTPNYPAEELLIDQGQWDAWLGAGVPLADRKKNVGRRVLELAIVYLPNQLLQLHCSERDAGLPHEETAVYGMFSHLYSVQNLENENLWARMDDKIESFGGCNNIPSWGL
jgi:hypothetical protein